MLKAVVKVQNKMQNKIKFLSLVTVFILINTIILIPYLELFKYLAIEICVSWLIRIELLLIGEKQKDRMSLDEIIEEKLTENNDFLNVHIKQNHLKINQLDRKLNSVSERLQLHTEEVGHKDILNATLALQNKIIELQAKKVKE